MDVMQPKCYVVKKFEPSSLYKSYFSRPLKTPIFGFPGPSPGFWSHIDFFKYGLLPKPNCWKPVRCGYQALRTSKSQPEPSTAAPQAPLLLPAKGDFASYSTCDLRLCRSKKIDFFKGCSPTLDICHNVLADLPNACLTDDLPFQNTKIRSEYQAKILGQDLKVPKSLF